MTVGLPDAALTRSVTVLIIACPHAFLQNLWRAAGSNIVALALAAGVLAPIGIMLPMAVGAVLMSASTVVVALRAQQLRGARIEEATADA